MEMVVRMEGMVENVLNRLVEKGYFKTKSEAVRAGILELGKEYALVGSEKYLVSRKIARLERLADQGKLKFTPLEEVARKAGVKI
ncbi:MAG: hypothetical protein V1787_00770 [Candidatus Micrarchaeota archaeon]